MTTSEYLILGLPSFEAPTHAEEAVSCVRALHRQSGRALLLAQEEARLLNHNFIGTEHMLVGLIHEGEGVAAKALEQIRKVQPMAATYCWTLASVSLYFATASDDGIQLHQYGDYRVSTELGAGRLTVQVSSAYPAGDTVSVTIVEAPAAEITLRLRVPAWAFGTVKASEGPTAQTPSHVEIRRVFRAGDSVRVMFPAAARATHPDPRIDSARGAFAVEQGPLVLALESIDLPPDWSVNEVTADPHSLAADDAGATTIEVCRRDPAPGEWPYYAEPDGTEGERVRVRLIPYHQWANRGPATMRTWLPVSSRRPADS